MCEQCAAIDKKIEQYSRISRSIDDQLTLDNVKQMIAELEAEKAKLHQSGAGLPIK